MSPFPHHPRHRLSGIVRRVVVATLLLSSLAAFQPVTQTFAAGVCPTDTSALETLLGAGGTVTLSCPVATTYSFTSQYTVSTNVTIDASSSPGAITFDGGNSSRLLSVGSGISLTLNTLTLQNASGAGNGGAISSSGTLIVSHDTFTGNFANGSGGAIYSTGALNVSGSTFSRNST